MDKIPVQLPLSSAEAAQLRAGQVVSLSGVIYTARDAAHKRFAQMLEAGGPIPLPSGSCVYYAGPCPSAPGEIIGPCGPTTSARMDSYAPSLLDWGVTAMIGKGPRSNAVKAAMKGRAVYFAATGGAGLLIARSVISVEEAAFPDLGPEAVLRLEIRDMPAIVAVDARGGDLYERGGDVG